MTGDGPMKQDPKMSEILASIRRIVEEEERVAARVSPAPPGPQGDVLELTEAMRIDPDAPEPAAGAGMAPEAVAPAPRAEASPAERAQAAPSLRAEASPTSPPAAAPSDPHPPEEAAMRALVRAVLADELDGALGARLRDIVREEIARVVEELAADD